MLSALQRQRDIYLRGISGQRPVVPVQPAALAAKAKEYMSAEAWAYIAGGAGRGSTMDSNRTGFDHWAIQPRMLRDVSEFDFSTTLFGQKLPAPVLLSPIGVLEMAHRRADRAVARAAASLGLPMIFSNQASVAMEDCAAEMGDSPRWFQLYWSKSDRLICSFVQRAEACGCSAIVVTLDTSMLGWRPQDLDLAYLPFLRGMGIAQYTSDPVFNALINEPEENALMDEQPKRKINARTIGMLIGLLRRYPGSALQHLRTGLPMRGVRQFINTYTNPALDWARLSFLREQTQLPILLKGILHPDDARRAVSAGMDGIIVSNHGGRQVDGALSAIHALPRVLEAANGDIPVLMDSGIRTGADAFKALALGADAVCVGRPYVYGLAIAGQAGVVSVLQNITAELELTMRLSGCRQLSEVNQDCLVEK